MTLSEVSIGIETGDGPHSGTDAPVFFGFFGTRGGREFRLDNANRDDNEAGYRSWRFSGDDEHLAPDQPDRAFFMRTQGMPGHLLTAPNIITIESLHTIYIRVDERTDAWEVKRATAFFTEETNPLFSLHYSDMRGESAGSTWLGNMHGMYLYLGR